MVLETKWDSIFPQGQFSIVGYSAPYGTDWHGGGIVLFVRDDIPS